MATSSGPEAAQAAGRALLLLPYTEPLQKLSTTALDLAAFTKPLSRMNPRPRPVPGTWLAEMQWQRGAMAAFLASPEKTVPESVLEGFRSLSARVEGLLLHVGGDMAAAGWRSEWSSPLSGKGMSKMWKVDGLTQELGMIYTAYAASLHQYAAQGVLQLISPSGLVATAASAPAATATAAAPAGPADVSRFQAAFEAHALAQQQQQQYGSISGSGRGVGSGPATAGGHQTAAQEAGAAAADGTASALCVSSVSALRLAAGVYEHLAQTLLPVCGAAGANQGSRPLELYPSAARALRSVCLAEAQAVMAARSAMKGDAPGTVAMLHAGCSNLFSAALGSAEELLAASGAGGAAASTLLRLCRASTKLHAARAASCTAALHQTKDELGVAEVCCTEAEGLLRGALAAVGKDYPAWHLAIQDEQRALKAQFDAIHKDRITVTYQVLPRQVPDYMGAAKVLVSPTAFIPQPQAPSVPMQMGGQDKACVLM